MSNRIVISGAVVAEPERSVTQGGQTYLKFPLYDNETRKNKDSGEYEATGQTTKLNVTLWSDLADTDVRKGDIWEVSGTIVEREFDKKDGTKGRSLQTSFVNEVELKYRKDDSPRVDEGFIPAPASTEEVPW